MAKNDFIQAKDEFVLKRFDNGETITVRDLQLAILPIMDEIHRICVQNNIPYGLIAGSALGIVNYHGFIPWDDDIDVCVLKQDWSRFIEAMKRDLRPEFYFQCFETDKKYNVLIPTMKVRKRDTYIEEMNVLLKNRCASGDGVFVDIIIYDNVSENKLQDELYRTLIKLIMPFIVVLDNLRFNPVFLKKLVIKIAEHYSNINEGSELVSQQIIIPWEKFMKEPVFRKKDVYPFQLYEFEGREYYSYRNLETIMTQWYGLGSLKQWDGDKWVEPFPFEKRKPSHVVDLNLMNDQPHKKTKK